MSDFVITAKKVNTDEAYLSAIFKDNHLVSVVQNKKISATLQIEHIAKFLLAIKSDEYYYPKNIEDFIKNNVEIIEAIDTISDKFIEIDF